MKLLVEVDRDREYLGRLTGVASRGPVFGPEDVCATARGKAARAAGNPEREPLRPFGHVPFGTYRFKETRAIPAEHQAEYGTHVLVFEPASGEALDAESYGRLELLIHSGDPGPDGRLRRTNGDLRVDRAMLAQLVRAASGGDLLLEVRESKPGFLERLTGRRPRPSDLRARRRDDDDDWDGDDWTDYDWSPSTSSDSSARVATAAALGAAGAAAATELAAEAAGEGTEGSNSEEAEHATTDTNY